MDRIVRGFSEATGLRFFYADVTESAATLERRHLSGPAAGIVLGRALAAVALLHPNLARADEVLSMQLKTDGPIGGFLVEVNAAGDLRGYTYRKILDDFDGLHDIDVSPLLGSDGTIAVIHSNSDRVLGIAKLPGHPPGIRMLLERYLSQSLQIASGVSLTTLSREGFLKRSTGLVVQKMPTSDADEFDRVAARFREATVGKFLESSDRLEDFRELLRVPDLESVESTPLRFRCGCTYEKIRAVVATLPLAEISAILDRGEAQRVVCHFCGETFAVRHEDLLEIFEKKSADEDRTTKPAPGD